ncbi:uncharacterized protein EURHEDRAFT_379493 [Aspergillus ruber CBS 135680]|uniref:Alcohol dehydrogenase iron-type/glycerol dehydrogenase GldA domain-containing protein n=1 Tax=Aspergillus ruber (strain CBS 135680) TaxID=1388766 RepID=A0A017S8Z0_ASPRC|nr:uncharacterized protein EURHEDRAFT_379493 [Aspergillus ruber CBS 135680]EYE93069.1 hypothetical protein EURHEDRAFT_379493 [Aspergillus ruber CBS 135680]
MPEVVRPAFATHPRSILSYGIPFTTAAALHVRETFTASKVYMIVSRSLAQNTGSLGKLRDALGPETVVGVRVGMRNHTLFSEILEVVTETREKKADLLLTLGGGSLSDAAKVVTLASWYT